MIPLLELDPVVLPEEMGRTNVTISNTNGWSLRKVSSRLSQVKPLLDWDGANLSALRWWSAFEEENPSDLGRRLVLRLAETLASYKRATLEGFFKAYVYSNIDNVRGNIDYYLYDISKSFTTSATGDKLRALKQLMRHHYNEYVRYKPNSAHWFIPAKNAEDILKEEAPDRVDRAAEIFEKAIGKEPDCPELLHRYASFLCDCRKDFTNASIAARSAIGHLSVKGEDWLPELAQAEAALGDALEGDGRTAEALQRFLRATRLDPYAPRLHLRFGLALRRANQLSQGAESYANALTADPYYSDAFAGLTGCLVYMGRLDEAMDVSLDEERRIGRNWSNVYNRLCIFFRKRQYNKAGTELKTLERIAKYHGQTRQSLYRQIREDTDFTLMFEDPKAERLREQIEQLLAPSKPETPPAEPEEDVREQNEAEAAPQSG